MWDDHIYREVGKDAL